MRNVVRLVQKMVDLVTEDDSLFSILGTVGYTMITPMYTP